METTDEVMTTVVSMGDEVSAGGVAEIIGPTLIKVESLDDLRAIQEPVTNAIYHLLPDNKQYRWVPERQEFLELMRWSNLELGGTRVFVAPKLRSERARRFARVFTNLLDWGAAFLIALSVVAILSGITFTFYPYIALRLLPEDITATCFIGGMVGVLLGVTVAVLSCYIRAWCGVTTTPGQ